MIYGYVRKLNKKESLDEQIKEIKANYPKATIIEEKNVSNARPKLKFMLNKATEGDIIVFSSLERFGIDLEEVYNITQSLKEQGVEIVVLNLPSDDLLMTLSAFKQFNKAMIVERTQLGRLKAMQKEDYKEGRPRIDEGKIDAALNYIEQGNSYTDAEKVFNISKSTLTRRMRERRALKGGSNTMLEVVLKELHDAKLKLVRAINEQDKDMIKKYEEVVKDLEKSAKALGK